jgi:GTP pyrophosphokinase
MQDPIKGFVTLGEGVSVHKYKCPQFLHISSKFPHRVIDLGWGETIDCFPVKIKIISYERPKMLADISTIIASNKANIINATFDSDKNSHLTTLLFEIEIIDFSKLGSIISSVENLSNIVSVERVT